MVPTDYELKINELIKSFRARDSSLPSCNPQPIISRIYNENNFLRCQDNYEDTIFSNARHYLSLAGSLG